MKIGLIGLNYSSIILIDIENILTIDNRVNWCLYFCPSSVAESDFLVHVPNCSELPCWIARRLYSHSEKIHLGMDQYLLIPFLGGWTSIYQLFWCSPGVQGFDTLPFIGGTIRKNYPGCAQQYLERKLYTDRVPQERTRLDPFHVRKILKLKTHPNMCRLCRWWDRVANGPLPIPRLDALHPYPSIDASESITCLMWIYDQY